MVDILSSEGLLKPALLAMELSQMLTQAMWISDSPLLQLPYFTECLVEKCKEKEIMDVIDLMNMEDKEREELLEVDENKIGEIASVCNRYPTITFSYELAQADAPETEEEKKEKTNYVFYCEKDITLTIRLQRDLEGDLLLPVYAPYFPNVI